LIILIFLLIRNYTKLHISDSVIDLLTTIIGWSLGLILLTSIAEIFSVLYSSTEHAASLKYSMFGHNGINIYVPWFWGIMGSMLVCFVAILSPKVRKSYHLWLPVVCVVVFLAIMLEKPMLLVFPAFSPSPFGEYTEYHPTLIEYLNVLLVWAVAFIFLTLIVKGAVGILTGEVRYDKASASK
jgi:hypothetical protein